MYYDERRKEVGDFISQYPSRVISTPPFSQLLPDQYTSLVGKIHQELREFFTVDLKEFQRSLQPRLQMKKTVYKVFRQLAPLQDFHHEEKYIEQVEEVICLIQKNAGDLRSIDFLPMLKYIS
mmetsp:Transcript_33500/g.51441  ORF Transcript_33500/g.51441 Transcript_33500/m.51441 type:complete len:122 (-) Transcript_33500:5129-5494(-)